MKYLILLFLLSAIQGGAQSLLSGQVRNLKNSRDSTFKIVFIQGQKRLDSVTTHSGEYQASIAPGIYDIEVSRQFAIPVLFRNKVLTAGNQTMDFGPSFTYSQKTLHELLLAQRPSYETAPSNHTSYFYLYDLSSITPIVCPPFMHRESDD